MPARLTWYDATDTTQQTATIPAGDVDGGTTYTLPILHLWNDLGGVFGDTVTAGGIVIFASVEIAGVPYLSGVEAGIPIPILDGRWIGVQVVGIDKTGDSTMQDQATGIFRIGPNAWLIIGDIPKNCARYVQFTVNVPAGVSNQPFNVVLTTAVQVIAVPLADRFGIVSGGGVHPDWMDASARRLTRGRALSASGTDTPGIANGSWVFDGLPHTQTKTTVTLNQTAAAGSLAAGESYIARLSQPETGAVTVTKGAKATTPIKPAVPADEINLGCVTVLYQSGGTSIINSGNLDTSDVIYGEFLVTDGGGLNARIGGGNAIASADSGPFSGSSILVALTDNATNTVWLAADGSASANTTGLPPSVGAQPLAHVVTASGAITSITDARTFAGHAVYDHVLSLRKSGAFNATATDVAWDVAAFDCAIMKIAEEIGKKGTASGGTFKADVTTRPPGTDLGTAGTTIFTSSGSDDFRPSVAYNASVLHAESVGHEVTIVTKGTRIAANIAAVPSGISVDPEDFMVQVFLRRL